MGQENYLPPATELTLRRYRAQSKTWEHEHCPFCFTKFMDPDFSEEHRRFIEEHPDVLTEGYTTSTEHVRGAGWHWICPRCVEDFADEFGWQIVEG
jgi:hypothetical protein